MSFYLDDILGLYFCFNDKSSSSNSADDVIKNVKNPYNLQNLSKKLNFLSLSHGHSSLRAGGA